MRATCFLLVGAGAIGEAHAQTIAATSGAKLAGIVESVPERAKTCRDKFHVPTFSSVEEALSQGDFDAACVATPESVRKEPLSPLLKARLPIFLEKPLATSLNEGKWIARAVQRARIPFQIGFQRRFDPGILAIFRKLKDWEPVELFRSITRDPAPPTLAQYRRSGGIVFSSLIHDIDLAHFFVGPIKEVFARGGKLICAYEDPNWVDTLSVSLLFKSGALGTLEVNWRTTYGYEARVEVFSRGGSLATGWGEPRMHRAEGVAWQEAGEKERSLFPQSFRERFGESYRAELQSFVRALHKKKTPSPGIKEALAALQVAAAVEQSLKSGAPTPIGNG